MMTEMGHHKLRHSSLLRYSQAADGIYCISQLICSTVQVIKKCPDVLSVLLGTDSTMVRSTVSTTVHSTVSTYLRTVRVKKKCPYGKVVATLKYCACVCRARAKYCRSPWS